jgi:hypothetical protein
MIDELISRVRSGLLEIADHRMSAGNLQYTLIDNLMAGFAMFSLKDSSLLEFRELIQERQENLRRIYHLEKIPQDSALRQTIDGVAPSALQRQFSPLISWLKEHNIWSSRRVLEKYHAVSVDGTGYFSSSNTCCDHCLVKEHRNGNTTYHHQLLVAVNVHPDEATVFPLMAEPITKQDGSLKNDCEQNAFKRLLPSLRKNYADQEFLILLDSLYPSGPCLRLLKEEKCHYLIGIKDGYVLVQAQALAKNKQLSQFSWKTDKTLCKVGYAEGLIHSGTHQDLLVNYLELEETDLKTGKTIYKGAWITDLPINEAQLPELVNAARARWKVENETFNTLKNQGYNLEHNYGHGQKSLASNFALLMLLAFLVDQIAQHADLAFQKAWQYCKTKKLLWNKVRQIFDLLPCISMNVIYRIISKEKTMDFQVLL